MSKKWEVLDRRESVDGVFELRRRARDDFLILIDGRVLMNSRSSRSEEILGLDACRSLEDGARVLVGGLGMGLTLRAVADALPPSSHIVVAELHSLIAEWCEGPLAELNQRVLADPRVTLRIADVAEEIREAAIESAAYDAILLDLFEGPHARTDPATDPLYGRDAIERTWRALTPGGAFGVWAEARDSKFESRLRTRGFQVESKRPGRGGLRHWIVLARRP